jgi:hypothetical protein
LHHRLDRLEEEAVEEGEGAEVQALLRESRLESVWLALPILMT